MDIDLKLKLTKGENYKIKGQGETCNSEKKICLLIMNWKLDLDDNNIQIKINETLKLTQGQGLKVKGRGQIWNFVKKKVFQLYIITNDWILMTLTHMITFGEML